MRKRSRPSARGWGVATRLGRCTAVLALAFLGGRAEGRVLVLAPHPDDDVILAAGVVMRALARGDEVRVVLMTNGDASAPELGPVRQAEAVAAQAELGVPEQNVIFLGYPDSRLAELYVSYPGPADELRHHGRTHTYGTRGLGLADYHTYRHGSPAAYNAYNVTADLAELLEEFRPDHVFVTSDRDVHADHQATHQFLLDAIRGVRRLAPAFDPVVHEALVWSGFAAWPNAASPREGFAPLPTAPAGLPWARRESLDVPLAMRNEDLHGNPKARAIARHASQGGVYGSFIGRFLHGDEIFWTRQLGGNRPPIPEAGRDGSAPRGGAVTLDASGSFDPDGEPLSYRWTQVAGPAVTLSDGDAARPTFVVPGSLERPAVAAFELVVSDGTATSFPDAVTVLLGSDLPAPRNVARLATAQASSENANEGQVAASAVDGVAEGYMAGDPAHEWVTQGQGPGAWIQLSWPTAQRVQGAVLVDRPNPADWITGGRLTFSDGSSVPVGPLDNDGAWSTVAFEARRVVWVRFTVTSVGPGTANIGLAEFQVLDAADGGATDERVLRVARGGTLAEPPPRHQRSGKPSERGEVNVARTASTTASSQNVADGQLAASAVDGNPDGYPARPSHEWATVHERTGAWIELSWPAAQVLRCVVLRDRPNPDDRVLAGVLSFEDGSTVSVGELDNAGRPTSACFAPKRTHRLRFTITATSGSTSNTGLAELEAWSPAGVKLEPDPSSAGGVVPDRPSAGPDPDPGSTDDGPG